jgi:hypothetical protein
MPERREALETAQRLVALGHGYNAIVWRLIVDLGLAERVARAVTAEAFRPLHARTRPQRPPTLRSELDAITRLLDKAPRRSGI